jgi:two-component system chemotaxis response regulator CheY
MSPLIMLVEDDEAIRESIVELMEGEGYTILAAPNGAEALALLHNTAALPALILLDLMMPVMDGFAFCEARAKVARIADIPVVIMSADGHVRQKQDRTGAADYIKKPLDIDDLLARVEALLPPGTRGMAAASLAGDGPTPSG